MLRYLMIFDEIYIYLLSIGTNFDLFARNNLKSQNFHRLVKKTCSIDKGSC